MADSSEYTYREEVFCASEDGPFWISVESPDGQSRSERDVLSMVDDFFGSADEPWVATAARGRVSATERGLRFDKDEDGPLAFWEVDVP